MLSSSLGFTCDYTSTLVLASAFLLLASFLRWRKPNNFPPGPLGLPVVGYTPFLGKNAGESIRKMKEKYGPVMSIQMGTEHWVVLNDFNSMQEVICNLIK